MDAVRAVIDAELVRKLIGRRERNGETEYRVLTKNKRYPKWIARNRFDSLVRFDAYDEEFDELARQNEELARQDEEELVRQEALRDHERLKTKNMKIVQQSGNRYRVSWSGETWEDEAKIPEDVLTQWEEDKLLKTPSPNK